ncbi:MAG: ferredoxin-type protein NapF [Helicobacteraceae bacterium]|nr:ferredoxin-type protein NapF [Helicobacteraceae bacterium]
MDRRELFSFLSSTLKGEEKKEKEIILRPPYFGDESAFDTECQNCDGKCATLCQEQIIIIGEDKTPKLNFANSGCTFCDECAIACEPNVLILENKQDISAKISINKNKCFSWNSTMCFSCKDPCLDNAINFQAMFKPSISLEDCTACGFCISRCPADAIEVGES